MAPEEPEFPTPALDGLNGHHWLPQKNNVVKTFEVFFSRWC